MIIPAGSASATITVIPINDALVEGDETVVVTLSPNAAYTVGSPSSATVTITSDDVTPPQTFTLTVTGTSYVVVTSSPPGIECPGDCTEVYSGGQAVTLTALPMTDVVFLGWGGDPDCADGVVTMTANRTCMPRFRWLKDDRILKLTQRRLLGAITLKSATAILVITAATAPAAVTVMAVVSGVNFGIYLRQLYLIAADPPDPNFTSVFLKQEYILPDVDPAGILPPQLRTLGNTTIARLTDVYETTEAWRVTLERYNAAVAAGDINAASKQLAALEGYIQATSEASATAQAYLPQLADALEGLLGPIQVTPNDVRVSMADLAQNGFTSDEQQALSSLGLSSQDIAQLRDTLLGAEVPATPTEAFQELRNLAREYGELAQIASMASVIISDDFNDGVIDSTKWTDNGWSGGSIVESGGALTFSTGSSSDRQLRTTTNIGSYSNFSITFRINIGSVSSDKNVGFWLGNLAEGSPGAGTGHRGYYVQFHGGTRGFNIGVLYDGASALLHDKYTSPNWTPATWYSVKIERIDGTVNIYFNEALVATDSTYASSMTDLYWVTGRTWRDPRSGEIAQVSLDDFSVTATSSPTAAVALNGSAFRTGQTITYQATLTPGSTPAQVDIYLGTLLPDGVTFLSLIQGSGGTISIVLGPSPIPFSANVMLTRSVIPFSYTFAGFEPVGTYLTHAWLVVAGRNPLDPANQLSKGVQAFQFNP